MLRARIAKRQLTSTAATAEQARQQSVAVLGRAVMAAGGNVAAHHFADRLGLLPADIASWVFGISASQSLRALRRIFTLTPAAP